MNHFFADWRRFFSDAPPLSYVLRETGRPWVRFHSLPQSKRYAETHHERSLVLERANAIAVDVLGDNPTWLVQAGATDLGWPPIAALTREALGLQYAGEFRDEDSAWPVHAVLTNFAEGKFDRLISEIAEDRAFRTLWLGATTGRVFAPYDGGMDVFLESQDAVGSLKRAYPQWLSMRDDGL